MPPYGKDTDDDEVCYVMSTHYVSPIYAYVNSENAKSHQLGHQFGINSDVKQLFVAAVWWHMYFIAN